MLFNQRSHNEVANLIAVAVLYCGRNRFMVWLHHLQYFKFNNPDLHRHLERLPLDHGVGDDQNLRRVARLQPGAHHAAALQGTQARLRDQPAEVEAEEQPGGLESAGRRIPGGSVS